MIEIKATTHKGTTAVEVGVPGLGGLFGGGGLFRRGFEMMSRAIIRKGGVN